MRRRELLKIPKWCNNPIGVNLVDMSERIDGYYVNRPDYTNGTLVPYENWAISDFIKVNPGETYRYQNQLPGQSGWGLCATYDMDKADLGPLARKVYSGRDETFTIPAGVYYIQLELGPTSEIDAGGVVTLERIS